MSGVKNSKATHEAIFGGSVGTRHVCDPAEIVDRITLDSLGLVK